MISPLLLGADSTHDTAQVNPRGPTHLKCTSSTCYSWSPRGASSERLGHGELGLLAKEAVPALTPRSPGGPWAVLPMNTAPRSRPAHQPEDEVDGEHGGHATERQPLQDGAAGAGAEALLLRAVHQGVQEAEHVQRGGAGTVRRWVHRVHALHWCRHGASVCNTGAGVRMGQLLLEKDWLVTLVLP